MEHIGKYHKFFWFIYKEGCPPCKVRQIRYSRHFGDVDEVRRRLKADVLKGKFTRYQQNWILWQTGLRDIK